MKQDKWNASPVYGGSQKTEAHRLCEQRLEEALQKLKEQNAFITQVSTHPAMHGIALNVVPAKGEQPEFVDVLFNGSMARFAKLVHDEIKPFDTVLIVQQGGLVGKAARLPSVGRVVAVKQVIASDEIEVSVGGESAVVRHIGDFPLEAGDRVVLDTTMTLILEKVPAPPAPVLKPHFDRVLWSDIGGQVDAKRAIEEAVIWPQKHATILAAYGQRGTKGLLFHGPPGCGKTLIAKATATEIAGQGNPGFFSVRGPELMNPYVGETERQIRQLFAAARKHHEDTGTRAVIFVDEADSCLGRRGRRLHSDISVPAFLVEMDGMESTHQPLVILATNRPHDLDEAIVREGRVDRRIEIKRPEREDVKELFTLYLRSRPSLDSLEDMAERGTMNLERSPLWHDRSGAMVASLVDRATAVAMKRDIESGIGKPSGIVLMDLSNAILEAAQQHGMGT